MKQTDDKKKINGFDTRRHEATFTMEVEELATKAVTVYRMISDQWLTPCTKPLRKAADEENAFAKAYLKKMGLEAAAQDKAAVGVPALQALTRAGGGELGMSLGDMSAKLAKLDGFAMRTQTRWVVEPPQGAAKPKATKSRDDDDDSGIDVTNGVGGFLGGLAKKAAKKKVKKAVEERAAAQDGKPAFTSTTEVLSVSDESLPKGAFDVPPDYKKK